MATITVASSLYVPILVGNAIDYIIGPSNVNFRLIAQILAEIGVVIGITALSQWIMNICNNNFSAYVLIFFMYIIIIHTEKNHNNKFK